MAAFQYKKTQTINLKADGFIDIKNMTIEVNGEIKNISTLLSDFDGSFVSLSVTTKDETKLDEPTEDEDSDEE